jgi:DNA polymerase-2
MHRDSCFYLNGRLHLDQRNSFTLAETGFEGLFETARLARLPLQVAARTSTGTAISSMQVALAVKEGVLIPVDKSVTEDFKGADELLVGDKGGLVFQPEPGLHASVGELDFASMYPTIMVRHNLSPETMNCPCCRSDGERVPENPSWVCRRRRGLIPRVLAPLLERRAKCREMKKTAETDEARKRAAARATAHKWMMVCSFGYLGYRNARFGRIEAHEATTAFGREALLRAKETAEDAGFEVLHGIVDCIWARRAGAGEEDFRALAGAIEEATDIRVTIEGVYRWLAFLPSREDPRRGVAQRYVGVFADGEVKARGIEGRRSDCPPFVRDLQVELLEGLAKAGGPEEGRAIAAGLVPRVAEAVERVRSGRLRAPDLVIWGRLSKDPEAYTRATPLAVASGQLVARGGKLQAGERVGYVLGDERPWAVQALPDGCPYDTEKYAELVLQAAKGVLSPFGVGEAELRKACGMAGEPEAGSGQLELALFPAG